MVSEQDFTALRLKVEALESLVSRLEQYREPDRQIWAELDDDYSRLETLERLHKGMAEDITHLGHRVQALTGWVKRLDTELAQLATIERVLKIHAAKEKHDEQRTAKDEEKRLTNATN